MLNRPFVRNAAILLAACVCAACPWVDAAAPAASAPATQPASLGQPKDGENPALNQTNKSATLDTPQERMSYFIGMQIAKMLKQQGLVVDVSAFGAGVADMQAARPSELTPAQLEQTIGEMQKMNEDKQAAAKAVAEKNKAAGAAFLAANAKKPGVTTLPSGLQYKVLVAGKGKQPQDSDTVTVNYKGTLVDGSVFDQSEPGEPATFQVGGLIPAWKEALVKMREGDRWMLYVPAELAYGPEGSGPIPPNSVLIFDMELLKVK